MSLRYAPSSVLIYMRITYIIINILGVLSAMSIMVFTGFACRSSSCATDAPRSLLVGAGVTPLIAFFVSAVIAIIAVRKKMSTAWTLLGLILGTVATYTSFLLLALAIEYVHSGAFEDAVPQLLYGSLSIAALVPLVAALNVGTLSRKLNGNARTE